MDQSEIKKGIVDENSPLFRPESWLEQPAGATQHRGVDQLFLDYFGLMEQPFGVTPDLRFLYLGSKHRQALDVLNFGTELSRGFMTLIAPPGMGKTSVLFQFLEGLRNKARTVFLCQTDCDSTELMRYIVADLGIDGKGMDLQEMRAVLSQVLMGEMQAGRRFVLVIDEAQNLNEKVLESVRLLSNFETPWMKLINIILVGQPQLEETLAKPSMAQLRQRVSFAVRIEPFTREEVDCYIDHRLWIAGYKGVPLFSVGARTLIAERSQGIPRNINNLCFCAMTYAWAKKRKTVDRETVSEILADLNLSAPVEKPVEQENGIPVPDFLRKTRVGGLQTPQSVSLTLPAVPARGWSGNFAVVCLLGVTLGFVGIQPDVQRRAQSSYKSISGSIRKMFLPTSSRISADSPSTAEPDSSPAPPKADGLLDPNNPKLSIEDEEKSSLGR